MFDFHNQLGSSSQSCTMGLLVIEGINNRTSDEKMESLKLEVIGLIQRKYGMIDRKEIKSLHPMDIYSAYYKKFGYTYHLLLQMESVIRGKPMPVVSCAVDAMFMAEMKNWLLTAGHDLAKISFPLNLKVATGERYNAINAKSVLTVPGDIMVEDGQGVISSILRGPDSRTSISGHSSRVLYTIYAPAGIEERLIIQHMEDIESYIKVISDKSIIRMKTIIGN
jgi:DNA/RNA-binding domain of Phe-tRNA-synthetase-like protein